LVLLAALKVRGKPGFATVSCGFAASACCIRFARKAHAVDTKKMMEQVSMSCATMSPEPSTAIHIAICGEWPHRAPIAAPIESNEKL
jgi:hypothetical protein